MQSGTSGLVMPPIVALLSLLMHGLIIVLSLSLAYTLYDGSLFSYHPTLMSLGLILFHGELPLGPPYIRP